MKNTLKYRLNLTVGDWSKDGHSITENFHIQSNLSAGDFQNALRKGYDIIFERDPAKNGNQFHLCEEYEDSFLKKEDLDRISKHFDVMKLLYDEEPYVNENGDVSIYSDDYVLISLEIAKVGNPYFRYKVVELPNIPIGGYGLFSN